MQWSIAATGDLARYVLSQQHSQADLRRFHRLRMTLLDTRAARCKYMVAVLQPPGDTTWTARWRHLASRLMSRNSA